MYTANQNDTTAYDRAKAKVERLKSFYSHLAVYLIFMVFFIFLNLRSGGFPWAIFPIVGWGFGLLVHASETFGWNPFFGKDWEERKIREFLDEDDYSSI